MKVDCISTATTVLAPLHPSSDEWQNTWDKGKKEQRQQALAGDPSTACNRDYSLEG